MAPAGREQGDGACRREGAEESGRPSAVVVYLVCAETGLILLFCKADVSGRSHRFRTNGA